MKRFENKVLWCFHIAIEGHGRTCREALLNAANELANRIETGGMDAVELKLIEAHEVSRINEEDIGGENE